MHTLVQNLPTMTIVMGESSSFQRDRTTFGWLLERNVPAESGEITIELAPLLSGKEEFVDGTTLLERTREMPDVSGQSHAERLVGLEKQRRCIPPAWKRQNCCLLFAGTVWLDNENGEATRGQPEALRSIPIMYPDKNGWCLEFLWLVKGLRLGPNCRIVRFKQAA